MKLVNLKTPGGIYLGKKTMIRVGRKDWDRIYNVLDKTIRGLIYLEFGRSLPNEYRIHHQPQHGPSLEGGYPELLKAMKWRTGETKHVFLYGFCRVPSSFNSVWVTQYFGVAVFLSFVMDDDLERVIKKGGGQR